MHKRTSKPTQTRRLAWISLVALAVLVLLLTIHSPVPIAHAQEPEPTPRAGSTVPPPPGDCWNGALSDEPLHCHILEEAQRAGHFEVVAMYTTHRRGPLHIYLRQTEPLSSEVGDFLRDKAYEYIEDPEAREYYGYACMPRITRVIPAPEAPEDCPERHLQQAEWQDFHIPEGIVTHGGALPHPFAYSQIVIEPGGADARRSNWAWASWTQVWPEPTGGGAGGASGFDVSDVDLTNIPDPDCDEEFDSRVWNSCRSWKEHTGLGIAGSRSNKVDTSYIQVKNAPGDEAELEALKQQIAPGYESSGYEIEIIPVKYDFGELWRWSVILDRFAFSAGNTVSIVGGEVSINSPFYSERPRHLWMNDVEPAGQDEWGTLNAELREILIVWALDHELAAEALPDLLPALGIPVDAVGLVAGTSLGVRAMISIAPLAASEEVTVTTVTVSNSPSEAAASQTDTSPDTNSEPESRTVPAAAEADRQDDTAKPRQQAVAADSSGKAAGSSVTPKTTETDQDSRATPDQQSVSAPTSGEQAVSEVMAKTSSETDRRDTRELNQQTAGDVTSPRSTNPPWVLMGVVGSVILALAVSAILLGVRLARQRA